MTDNDKTTVRQEFAKDGGRSFFAHRGFDLLEIARKADERDERFRRSMLWASLVFFWLLSSILFVAIFIFSWHKLMPVRFEFLSMSKIENLQLFLLSGALTAFLSSIGRKMVGVYRGRRND